MPSCNKCGKSSWSMWNMKQCNFTVCKVTACNNCKDFLGITIPNGGWYCLAHKDEGFEDELEKSVEEKEEDKSIVEEDNYHYYGINNEIVVFFDLENVSTNKLITDFLKEGYVVFSVKFQDEIVLIKGEYVK